MGVHPGLDGTTFEPTPAAVPLPDARNGLRAYAGTDVLYVLDTGRGVLTAADPCPPVCFRRAGAGAAQPGAPSPQMSGALQAAVSARRQAVVRGRRAASRR